MAQYDLTDTLSKYLDRHLIFPLLEFLSEKQLYSDRDIQQGKIELLQNTNMVDYMIDIYTTLHNGKEAPKEMMTRREEVVAKLNTLQAAAESIVAFLSDPSLVKQLKQDKAYNLQFLQIEYQIGPEQIDALYHFAKFQFECGNYSGAAEYLYHYMSLSTNSERNLSALWGKLAAGILMLDWETAMEDVLKLQAIIDGNNFTPQLVQLQQRAWLMHWALYIFFNHENGRNVIVDMFLGQERYLNTLQTTCQHLLRYVATAVVINKVRKRNVLKELLRVIAQESYEYSDPITQFLQDLFINYDFEGAQQRLKECEEVIDNDYFLVSCKAEFMEQARLHIFETYCKIHKVIDLNMLAEKLNMDSVATEKWIVNLIRNARLDAKIDSQAGTVVMGEQGQTPYEELVERSKQLGDSTFSIYAIVNPAGGPRA